MIHTKAGSGASNGRALRLARSPVMISVLLFVAIVALRIAGHSSQRAGILLLLIGPIVLLSLSYRPLVGAAAATACLASYLLTQQVLGDALDAISVGTRAFTYYAIPLAIWLARHEADLPAAAPASEPAAAPEQPSQSLTPREREVLGLVAAGHTSAEIADMLVLSVRTIESHRASLRRKLGRPSAPELVRHAQRRGLLAADGSATHPDGVAVIGSRGSGLVY